MGKTTDCESKEDCDCIAVRPVVFRTDWGRPWNCGDRGSDIEVFVQDEVEAR